MSAETEQIVATDDPATDDIVQAEGETILNFRVRLASGIRQADRARQSLALTIGMMLIRAKATFADGETGIVDKASFLTWTESDCELKAGAYLYIQAAEVALANPVAVEKLKSKTGRPASVRSLAMLHKYPVKNQNKILAGSGKNPSEAKLQETAKKLFPPVVKEGQTSPEDRKFNAALRKYRDAVPAILVACEAVAIVNVDAAIREAMYRTAKLADGLLEKAVRQLVDETDNPAAKESTGTVPDETPPGVDPDPSADDERAAENAAIAAAALEDRKNRPVKPAARKGTAALVEAANAVK